jgi:hypothetical protein
LVGYDSSKSIAASFVSKYSISHFHASAYGYLLKFYIQ